MGRFHKSKQIMKWVNLRTISKCCLLRRIRTKWEALMPRKEHIFLKFNWLTKLSKLFMILIHLVKKLLSKALQRTKVIRIIPQLNIVFQSAQRAVDKEIIIKTRQTTTKLIKTRYYRPNNLTDKFKASKRKPQQSVRRNLRKRKQRRTFIHNQL